MAINLHGYTAAIMKATGADAREASVIEEIMRLERPTLDALTGRGFDVLARQSVKVLAVLRDEDPETAAFFEKQASS